MAKKNLNIDKRASVLIDGFQKMHDVLIDTASNAVDSTVKSGTKWQKMTEKVIKDTAPLREKQIDLAFQAAEGVKDQVQYGVKRFNKLTGLGNGNLVGNLRKTITENAIVTKLTDSVNPLVKELTETGEKMMGTAEKKVKKAKKTATKTVSKAKKTATKSVSKAKKTAKKASKKVTIK